MSKFSSSDNAGYQRGVEQPRCRAVSENLNAADGRNLNYKDEIKMNTQHRHVASLWRRAGVAALLASALSMTAAAASAGECPADKRVPDGQGQKDAGHAAKGVTDTVRSAIDLSNEAPMLKDRMFRLRQLDIAPGGIVPFHSHNDRPAQIYIVKGTIVEYATNCAVPITHTAGDIAPEKRGVSHWWQNNSNEPVVLISVDILHDKPGVDKKMM